MKRGRADGPAPPLPDAWQRRDGKVTETARDSLGPVNGARSVHGLVEKRFRSSCTNVPRAPPAHLYCRDDSRSYPHQKGTMTMTMKSSFFHTSLPRIIAVRTASAAHSTVATLRSAVCHSSADPMGQAQVSVLALSTSDVARVNLTVTGPVFSQPWCSRYSSKATVGGLLGCLLPVAMPRSRPARPTIPARNLPWPATSVTIGGQIVTRRDHRAADERTHAFSTPARHRRARGFGHGRGSGCRGALQATAHDPNPGGHHNVLVDRGGGTLSATNTPNLSWTAPRARQLRTRHQGDGQLRRSARPR